MAATTVTPSADLLSGSARRRFKERLVKALFQGAALFSLIVSVAIILALIGQAISWLFEIDLSWLWADVWSPRSNQFDILTLFLGTMLI